MTLDGVTALLPTALAAVIIFWSVGAYNRLKRARQGLPKLFMQFDTHHRLRHEVLGRWGEALRLLMVEAEALDSLDAALQQSQAACEHARVRPTAPQPLASLRLADEVLVESRNRVLADLAGIEGSRFDDAAQGLLDELAASDASVEFARRQFNEAVQAYNAAIHQFPTVLLARPFGFRPIGSV
jgi:LemA protein